MKIFLDVLACIIIVIIAVFVWPITLTLILAAISVWAFTRITNSTK